MEFAKKITESAEEIFSTMIFMNVTAGSPMEEGKEDLGCHVSAVIGLTGDLTAMLGIHCPEQVGLGISGAMLGMELNEIDADVKDALGEIANMVAGGLKERFSRENIKLELAIPTTVAGKSYTISSPTRSNRIVIPFSVEQGHFFIEIKYNLT
ncbi:MAG: chemotaxis protein CheX [Desulfuromonadales bacterium]|nr:chemotaxis protein CheX [Desulfuromonadales bacterium]MBN2791537.1 chemotaxis protein CheX [Desulfuromonadales bacterium]